MSNLIKHAQHELALIREDQDVVDGYLKVIQAFADMKHSGGSASVALPVLVKLLKFENLAALTNDPEEWEDRSVESGYPIWQNRRNSNAFSYDGGKTYWLLGDVKKIITAKEKR